MPGDHAELEIQPLAIFIGRVPRRHPRRSEAPLKPYFRALA